jgi:hypothetical protein
MNLQENINRIKEVMGVINEGWEILLKRRIHNIDELMSFIVGEVTDRNDICEWDVDEFLVAVAYSMINHMYWDFFGNIDEDSEEWSKMYKLMEKYIYDKFGEELRQGYHIICGN